MSANHWRTILVVVTNPFAREQLAATKAAAVARSCGARLVLFNAFMVPQPVVDVPMDSRDQIIESATRQRRTALRAIASRLRMPRNTECVARWDYPIDEAIVRQVRKTQPDLLISESHRHGRLARLVLANTDWQLIRDCPCALWFMRSKELAKRPQLLVAIDPRHAHAKPARLDDRLLRAARGFARQLGGRIAVVHAYPRFAGATASRFFATTNEMVTKLAAKHGVSSADCAIRAGMADEVIAAEAGRIGADILVMGAVSRSFPARPVIGNTAERVIDYVDCDVFVVKPSGIRKRARLAARRRKRREPRNVAADPAPSMLV